MAAQYFVDENDLALGKLLAAEHTDVVYPGHPGLPEVPRGALDDDWLPVIGRLKLVVITRDRKIRYRSAERRAWIEQGESIADVLPGLVVLARSMRPGPDGMCRGSVTLEHATAAPLVRALMRAEAELMLEDADSYRTADSQQRTHQQRAADAIVRLASRLGNCQD